MLTLRIEYLTGRCVATAYNDRQEPEWPPHPARVYSALVDTLLDNDPPSDQENDALRWLSRAGAPAIAASTASQRDVVPCFVPVNDQTVISGIEKKRQALVEVNRAISNIEREIEELEVEDDQKTVQKKKIEQGKLLKKQDKAAAAYRLQVAKYTDAGKPSKAAAKTAERMLPDSRLRQMRHFPSVTPVDPVVSLIWDGDPSPEQRKALAALSSRLVRIGHSSSLVACQVVDDAPEPTWRPDPNGKKVIRVPGPGQLEQLLKEWEIHRGVEPRVLPCRFERYSQGTVAYSMPIASSSLDGDWVVFRRVGGPRLPITRCVELSRTLHKALLSHAEEPIQEELSGHRPDGSPSQRPHVAVLALPFVGHRQADGSLLGLAVIEPRDRDDATHEALMRTIGRWEEKQRVEDEDAPRLPLYLKGGVEMEIERVAFGEASLSSLRRSSWCGPSRRWLTVTPIALDRNPGNLYDRDRDKSEAAYRKAAETVAQACCYIGLPLPHGVTVLPSGTLPGTIKARKHPPYPPEDDRFRRVKVHARITFTDPVEGPVLLGAGRYAGLGLCKPTDR
jgi:CRISPR-associated protein Csb2